MTDLDTLEQMVDFLAKAPFFRGAGEKAIEDLIIDSDIIPIKEGEVIIHEGEYELICYVTLSGRFKIEVTDKETGSKRFVRMLGAGEILGEMSVLSGNPRLAEVACVEEGQALKIVRDELLRFLDAAPAVKSRIDADYRQRSLSSALRRLEVFSQVDDLSIKVLSEKVELVTKHKNETIFNSGDEADAFYLVRDGFVKMSRELAGDEGGFFDSRFDKSASELLRRGGVKEYTLAYLGPGAYFGERALFADRKRVGKMTAVTRVELVSISKADFTDLMRRHPLVAQSLREKSEERYAQTASTRDIASQDVLSWVESHDILGADQVLILDLDKCVRCLHCIKACAKLHGGVSRITHNGIRYRNILIPTSCRHCREPTCMIGCPTGAIQRDKNGEVFHTDACIGCGNCARKCPFGNISIVSLKETGRIPGAGGLDWIASLKTSGGAGTTAPAKPKTRKRAVKCDLCKGFSHMGCQHNCPSGAIMTIKPSEYFARLTGYVEG